MPSIKKTEEALAKVIKEYIIPSTAGNAGKVLSTMDGSTLSWQGVDNILPAQSASTENKILVSDGVNVSWKAIKMKHFTVYAEANQTTIPTTSYNIQAFMQLDVFKDGIKLIEGAENDYTYNTTTKVITLTTPLFNTDIIMLAYLVFE